MLGFDPLYVASEGRSVAIVSSEYADETLQTLRGNPHRDTDDPNVGRTEGAPQTVAVSLTMKFTTRNYVLKAIEIAGNSVSTIRNDIVSQSNGIQDIPSWNDLPS